MTDLTTMLFLPPWQFMVAVAAGVFALQQKSILAASFLRAIHTGLAECSYCLGAVLGTFVWGTFPLFNAGTSGWTILASGLVWMLCSAASSYAFEVFTSKV